MIEMKNINLSFKNHILFKNQNISIPSSQITLITGESGSGKSTLLFELAGLTHYSKNEFYTDSNDYGFVFQDCRLFDDLTAIQNIQLFSELAEVPFHKDQMMKLLDELDLNIDLNGKVDILSGGQKQRLLILCCMMKNPDIIFLDEPTAYLDTINREHMRKIIHELCHRYHKTVVIATHDMGMLEIADTHYHIEHQQIILKKESYTEINKIEPKEHIHTNPVTYYLKAEKSNRIHYKRNIVISIMMIIVTYMMCFQAYYQKETDTMINKAIDNELRISYKDGGNAYDMGGQPIPKTLIQDISNNSMVQSIQPFFQWNVLNTQETIVIQPYYGNMKTYKTYTKQSFSIENKQLNTDHVYISYSLYQKLNKNIHITGILQIPTSNTYTFNKIPFELVNANVTDKDIHNRYTKTTENIIYISPKLYQKIVNQYTQNNTYQSNVYIIKVNSYKNIQSVTEFIKKHDSDIKVYNPVSSAILNKTTTFGFEMIQQFSMIMFVMFMSTC
ncbi:ATP-binding cassette domain-containing protein, partial [Catenibacterium mitsuokai]